MGLSLHHHGSDHSRGRETEALGPMIVRPQEPWEELLEGNSPGPSALCAPALSASSLDDSEATATGHPNPDATAAACCPVRKTP